MAGVGFAELGVAPSAADLASLTGDEAVSVMRLAQRQKNAADAVHLAAVVEVGVRGLDSGQCVERMAAPDRWAADEIRAGLAISRTSANDQLDFAWTVVRRLPKLHAAMARGDLDTERARTIARWTKDMSDEHAQAVVDDVLERCSIDAANPYTSEGLSARCKALGIALDPDWALRAFAEALKARRVIGWRNEDGTSDLAAQHQHPGRVAAAIARVKTLAAKARAGGDDRPLDHIRSELCMSLLDGTYAGLDDAQILAALAATRAETAPAPAPAPAQTPQPTPSHAGVQLTVKLSTLLGLDRHPADLAGWGPTHAEHARELAQKLSAGQWRYAVLDADGQTIRSGLTPARPKGWARRQATDAGVVDLLVPAELLHELTEGLLKDGNLADPATLVAWLPVIEDIARRADGTNTSTGFEPEPSGGPDPHRRFPGKPLRRELELRIRTCIGTGCRRPARTAEMDHTLDHGLGGLTVLENLGPACEHDHDLKTKGGWGLKRLDETTFRWTSRLGRTYDVPIAPLIEDLPPPGGHPIPAGRGIPDQIEPDRDLWFGNPKPAPGPAPDRPVPRPVPDEPPF